MFKDCKNNKTITFLKVMQVRAPLPCEYTNPKCVSLSLGL